MAKIYLTGNRFRSEKDYEIYNSVMISLIEKGHEIISDELDEKLNRDNFRNDNYFNELILKQM